jgi:hypothetical protein
VGKGRDAGFAPLVSAEGQRTRRWLAVPELPCTLHTQPKALLGLDKFLSAKVNTVGRRFVASVCNCTTCTTDSRPPVRQLPGKKRG